MCSQGVKIIVSCLVAVISISMATANDPRHLVQLRTKAGESFCAGALVSPAFVVTAAKCIEDKKKDDVVVFAGIRNNGRTTPQERAIKNWYNEGDVAVIALRGGFDTTQKKIARIEMCSESLTDTDKVKVQSWVVSNKYETTDIDLTSSDDCSASETTMCFSEPKKCLGSIGAPVVLNGKLCGISIVSPGCSDSAGQLINIAMVRDYINSIKSPERKTKE